MAFIIKQKGEPMRKTIFSLLVTSVFSLTANAPAAANIAITMDHLKQDLDKRFQDVQKSSLKTKYKEQAMVQLQHMKARYNTANSFKSAKSQQETATEICTQLKREITSFDKRFYDYKLASAKNKSERKSKS